VAIDLGSAVERVLAEGDEWQSWRALRLSGEAPEDVPDPPSQTEEGAFVGPSGRPSPGATGEALCHLAVIGLVESGLAAIAGDWLEEARTPAQAWLDSPDDVPGELDDPAGSRVWATAAAACGLLVVGRDPGPRALELLRGEADVNGRFTGGAYPTFAAAGAYWKGSGPQTEMAEWALRWARENVQDDWEAWDRATGLTFWAAAGVPFENLTVETYLDQLQAEPPSEGWADDLGLTLRALELVRHYEDR
jgi:hypothetical protein